MLPLEIFLFHVTADFDNFGPSVYIYVPNFFCGILTQRVKNIYDSAI